ncbi:uncharacterized protein K460DRAFT_17253 [Cucurbitaria berberidis CBS 394.84]|uniref:Uncharacterized protein n=1 Tax=Cucurbitaria berberidis CBS 394.84 TaxID=1168544 RepID=A0A9P4GS98_9PLEO|nr:uncharacterized protein K460DRAFT_17253 [Cucurbitaria berberidis CBS 394.84]KAF1850531.1 hypothetical protein K460DRAFT_17253 [Cucurbitaria berberidis CBS 394.84]
MTKANQNIGKGGSSSYWDRYRQRLGEEASFLRPATQLTINDNDHLHPSRQAAILRPLGIEQSTRRVRNNDPLDREGSVNLSNTIAEFEPSRGRVARRGRSRGEHKRGDRRGRRDDTHQELSFHQAERRSSVSTYDDDRRVNLPPHIIRQAALPIRGRGRNGPHRSSTHRGRGGFYRGSSYDDYDRSRPTASFRYRERSRSHSQSPQRIGRDSMKFRESDDRDEVQRASMFLHHDRMALVSPGAEPDCDGPRSVFDQFPRGTHMSDGRDDVAHSHHDGRSQLARRTGGLSGEDGHQWERSGNDDSRGNGRGNGPSRGRGGGRGFYVRDRSSASPTSWSPRSPRPLDQVRWED